MSYIQNVSTSLSPGIIEDYSKNNRGANRSFHELSGRDLASILIKNKWELWASTTVAFNKPIQNFIRTDLEQHFTPLFGQAFPGEITIQVKEKNNIEIKLMRFSSRLILPIITKKGAPGVIYMASIEKKDFSNSEQNFFGIFSTLLSACYEYILLRNDQKHL